MNDCRHIFGVSSPLAMPSGSAWLETTLLLPERVACDARGVDVFVEGAANED